jgi:hypothetical protein
LQQVLQKNRNVNTEKQTMSKAKAIKRNYGIYSKRSKMFLNFSTVPRWQDRAVDTFARHECHRIINRMALRDCTAKRAA